jgi:hypothetical protein
LAILFPYITFKLYHFHFHLEDYIGRSTFTVTDSVIFYVLPHNPDRIQTCGSWTSKASAFSVTARNFAEPASIFSSPSYPRNPTKKRKKEQGDQGIRVSGSRTSEEQGIR